MRPLQIIQLNYFNYLMTTHNLSKDEAIIKMSYEACPTDKNKRWQFKEALKQLIN